MSLWDLQLKSFRLLNMSSKRRYLLIVLAQSSLGVIDILGVLLMGLIGAVASANYAHVPLPHFFGLLLKYLGVSRLQTTNAILVLSIYALLFFLIKTVLALVFTKKAFTFLARQQNIISSKLVSKVLDSDYSCRPQRNERPPALSAGCGHLL